MAYINGQEVLLGAEVHIDDSVDYITLVDRTTSEKWDIYVSDGKLTMSKVEQ